MTHNTPRTIDHLVLPVADINVARERYEKMGFTVAPDGLHPFGTENCCVFFEDNTFLEPIGIAHRETCEEYALKGHTFLVNDQTFRFRRSIEGFSHLVIKTDDANADHALYKEHGISGGKKVRFSRKFGTQGGKSSKVSFKLAFASDPRSPDAHFFACEVVKAPKVDSSALRRHANGVTGIREVILSEVNPTDFQYMFQTFLNQRHMDADSFGMGFETDKGKVTVLSPDGMQAFYGMETERRERGLQFQAFVLGVDDIDLVKSQLEKSGVEYRERAGRLIVDPAPGQGTTIMFEGNA